MVVSIQAVDRLSKEALAAAIASRLGIATPAVSAGGSVSSEFLDEIYESVFGGSSGGADTYRKTERLLSRLGFVYDPWWDTSEAQATGGGTVTARAFSRVLSAIAGQPRCFVIDQSSLDDADTLEINRIATRDPFAEAGPGSKVLLVSASNGLATAHAWAEVAEVWPGWSTAPWFARLAPRHELSAPVEVKVEGIHPGPPRIIEISWTDFRSVVGETSGRGEDGQVLRTDRGAGKTAERIDREYPAEVVPIGSVSIPELDASPVDPVPMYEVEYIETEQDGRPAVASDESSMLRQRRSNDHTANRLAEERAITYALRSLHQAGWTLVRDCQKDGVGYDLLFERGQRRLKVEVKGIQGHWPTFNITPKEWWRALTDPEWVVVAVTSVLSPSGPGFHVVTRAEIVSARRVPLGYRVWINA